VPPANKNASLRLIFRHSLRFRFAKMTFGQLAKGKPLGSTLPHVPSGTLRQHLTKLTKNKTRKFAFFIAGTRPTTIKKEKQNGQRKQQ